MGGVVKPRPLSDLPASFCQQLTGVFCDIDDTLTWDGRLIPEAFMALSKLQSQGMRVVPITGRPAGWVDQIARLWPVDGVVGENGGLWFWRDDEAGELVRRFEASKEERARNRERLKVLSMRILKEVPGCALASDQAYRELDVAIDFCEDVRPALGQADIERIVALFHEAGATCKVSSIHVNGWFGTFDKLSGCRRFLQDRWGLDLDAVKQKWIYVGDSANDEPMFAHFPHTVGVANVQTFLPYMKSWPDYITPKPGGGGFAQLADCILAHRHSPA
jgi:HAD superfamily hydrolase (TIGR01484 family)